jgi:ankyrin repeat protein
LQANAGAEKLTQKELNERMSDKTGQPLRTGGGPKTGVILSGLLTAIDRNEADTVGRLLREGTDPNLVDSDGRTPLMHAVTQGRDELVNLLLQNKADPDVQDRNGFSALHFAAQDYRAFAGRALLHAGAQVDLKDRFGNTALWRAVFHSRGRGEMIEMLLKSGADRFIKNNSDVSPIDLAQTIANYDIKQFFD